MSHYPVLGSPQLDVRGDGAPPRIHPFGLLVVRALDGRLAPLNAEISVAYLGRSAPATIYDSFGVSGSLVASAAAFTMADWDRDGANEEELLQLSNAEALRYFDATSDALQWSTGPKVLRLEWLEQGNAIGSGERPYWSLTNDAASGAWLAVRGSGTGAVRLQHHNGTSSVESAVPVENGDCCSLRGLLYSDGSVQAAVLKNGGSVETIGTRSAALLPASDWGNGAGVQARLNEFGTASRGTMLFRHFGAYDGTATRRDLMEIL